MVFRSQIPRDGSWMLMITKILKIFKELHNQFKEIYENHKD
jgi:hypothetical protein